MSDKRDPLPATTRRAEIEQARRTVPVQNLRAQVRGGVADDEHIRLMAEAIRRLLRRK